MVIFAHCRTMFDDRDRCSLARFLDSNTMECLVPLHAALGPVWVVLLLNGAVYSSGASLFTFVDVPSIFSVVPAGNNSIGMLGDDIVTVIGTNFLPGAVWCRFTDGNGNVLKVCSAWRFLLRSLFCQFRRSTKDAFYNAIRCYYRNKHCSLAVFSRGKETT